MLASVFVLLSVYKSALDNIIFVILYLLYKICYILTYFIHINTYQIIRNKTGYVKIKYVSIFNFFFLSASHLEHSGHHWCSECRLTDQFTSKCWVRSVHTYLLWRRLQNSPIWVDEWVKVTSVQWQMILRWAVEDIWTFLLVSTSVLAAVSRFSLCYGNFLQRGSNIVRLRLITCSHHLRVYSVSEYLSEGKCDI